VATGRGPEAGLSNGGIYRMGSRSVTGGRLPATTRTEADHQAPGGTPSGPPPESTHLADSDQSPDTSHVTLKVAELQRLLHPKPAAD
jgi:hypothetical protein